MRIITKVGLGWVVVLAIIGVTPGRAATSVYGSRPNSSADSGNFGLGLMLGEPSGLSGKLWLSPNTAVDFGFSYSLNNYVALTSDYLWHFGNLIDRSTWGRGDGAFLPFAGIGGILFVNNSTNNSRYFSGSNQGSAALGVRVPFGLEFLPRSAPLGFFAELAPGLGVVPDMFGFIDGAIGGRFYF